MTEHKDIRNLGLQMLLVTGLRVGELCTLKWSDVEDDHYIHINRTETKLYVDNKPVYEVKEFPKTKAGIRTVIVPQDYRWIFKELRKINPSGEFIFMKNDKRMLGSAFRDRLYNVCVKIGIDKKSPHKCRKTYASILLNHGVDESLAISQLGHSDITCTENFYHKDLRSDSEKASIIDEINDFQAAKKAQTHV